MKNLDQPVNNKTYSQDFDFITKDLIYFRGYRDWSVDFFDRKIEDLTGYQLEDFLDRRIKWLDIVYEDDRDIARDAVKRALASDRYYIAEYRIVNRQGGIKWVVIRGYIECDDNGDFLAVRGVLNELTPQKYTELALEAEHAIFAWIANNVEDGIYIVSRDYRILFMNKALIDLVGDHQGKVCYEALFQRDSPCPWTVMESLGQQGDGVQEYQFPGTSRIFQVRSSAITMPSGSIAKMGLFKDITRRRRLQEEVKEFAIRQEAVDYAADKADLGICIIQDHEGIEARFKYANEAFFRITGYTLEELLEKSLADLTEEDAQQAFLERYRRRQAGEILNRTYELEMVHKEGGSISVSYSAALSLWRGRAATILFLQDITERRRVQEALWQSQQLASIGRLAAEIAHEINNPLAVVLTYIRLMLKLIARKRFTRGRLEDVNRYLSTMEEEVSFCGEIVKNLLAFARQSKIEMKPNSIHKIIDKAFLLISHDLELRGIQVIREVEEDLPAVNCDFKQIQQALFNVLNNAAEAMTEGGILTLRAYRPGEDDFIEVAITDTGCGIPAEDQKEIFEPFFTTKEEGKGVGLGLAVAYGIITRHQGTIDVESPPADGENRSGTSFRIRLPLSEQGNDEQDDRLEVAG